MRAAIGSILVRFALLAAPITALGTPLNYSESASGDLPSLPTSAFSFDIGTNTIAGTTHLAVNFPDRPHFDVDFDNFAFILPTATNLVALSLAFVTTTFNASKADMELNFCAGISFCGIDSPILGSQTISLLDSSPAVVDLGGLLPLGPGTYTLLANGLGIAPISTSLPEGWLAGYVWTFAVVPEPGTLALLGLGLAGLAVTRRRKL